MESKNVPTMEQIEQRLLVWQKWLYAYYSAALVMLAQAFIKNYENTILTGALFFIEGKAGVTNLPSNSPMLDQYFYDLGLVYISPARFALWLFIQLAIFACAAILVFFPPWRKVNLSKRMDLIFGFLLAAWINLLALGAQDPLNTPSEYNALAVIYLLALGIGYWGFRHKKDKAEEVFP